MAITIEKVAQRVYLVGDTYAAKDRIKSMGGHWDGDRRAWWVGVKKEAEARALVASLSAPLAVASEASAQHAETIGLRPDAPAGMVADKLEEEGHTRAAAAIRQPKQDPHDIRLTGKGTYKGRPYYIGATTRDGTRCRLLTLPDANGDYLDFWADVAQVEVTKRYESRQVWDGRRYSGRTVTKHTTLGSIADFIARQRREEAAGTPACAACGKRGELHHDLEDGCMKCRGCCDIPE